jgi:hypothetical protein
MKKKECKNIICAECGNLKYCDDALNQNSITLGEIKKLNEKQIISLCLDFPKDEQWPDETVYNYVLGYIESPAFGNKILKEARHDEQYYGTGKSY